MGAGDDLASGTSTFMAELYRTSRIIQASTPRSLVILDELGRGTSTHDGVAIAMATLGYFIDRIGCSLLFVTHFPAVADMISHTTDIIGTNTLLDNVKGDEQFEQLQVNNEERKENEDKEVQDKLEVDRSIHLNLRDHPNAAVNIHMGYIETDENGNISDSNSASSDCCKRNVTFLYKAVQGAAGSSYGLNVARLVGLDNKLLQLAFEKAQWMKQASSNTA